MSDLEDTGDAEQVNNPGGTANQDTGETLDLIRHYFDRKFDTLKTEILAETRSSDSLSRKRKIDEVTFKSTSNKIQYRFNCEILELVEKAEASPQFVSFSASQATDPNSRQERSRYLPTGRGSFREYAGYSFC